MPTELSDTVYTIGGKEYRKSGWVGCQLYSIEGKLEIGSTRVIMGELFYVWDCYRAKASFKYEVKWCMVKLKGLSVA